MMDPAHPGVRDGAGRVTVAMVVTGTPAPLLLPVVFRSPAGGFCIVTVSGVPETTGMTWEDGSVPASAATAAGMREKTNACRKTAVPAITRTIPAAIRRAPIPRRKPAAGAATRSCPSVSGSLPPQEGQKRQAGSGMMAPQYGQKEYAMICQCRVGGLCKKGIRCMRFVKDGAVSPVLYG